MKTRHHQRRASSSGLGGPEAMNGFARLFPFHQRVWRILSTVAIGIVRTARAQDPWVVYPGGEGPGRRGIKPSDLALRPALSPNDRLERV
ncbi:MAG: hypothetical protein O2960_16735 [Verrucomicrobia bacterium]|nr:hypothetical protein [Verrucomicrobiota bacterium]